MKNGQKRAGTAHSGAGLLMVLSFVGILLPITGIALMMGKRIGSALGNSDQLIYTIRNNLEVWEERLGYDITSQIDGNAISGWLAENLKNAAGGTFTVFISLAIMYFLLFFMFTVKKDLRKFLYGDVPVDRQKFQENWR